MNKDMIKNFLEYIRESFNPKSIGVQLSNIKIKTEVSLDEFISAKVPYYDGLVFILTDDTIIEYKDLISFDIYASMDDYIREVYGDDDFVIDYYRGVFTSEETIVDENIKFYDVTNDEVYVQISDQLNWPIIRIYLITEK